MNKKNCVLLLLIAIFFSSCFAPVNLTYESAKTLEKGEFDVQGNLSRYFGFWHEDEGLTNYNNNFGLKLGYGLDEKITIKLRYERLYAKTDFDFGIFDSFNPTVSLALNYFELGGKFQFNNPNIALGIPVAYYFFQTDEDGSEGLFAFDPRMYFTFFSNTNKFELNLIPKTHLLFNGNGFAFMPGLSVGMGFSSDLTKWALRPEVGYDGYFSYGLGLTISIFKINKVD